MFLRSPLVSMALRTLVAARSIITRRQPRSYWYGKYQHPGQALDPVYLQNHQNHQNLQIVYGLVHGRQALVYWVKTLAIVWYLFSI